MTGESREQSLPQAIFFDLDGTLLDSLAGIQYSAQAAVNTVLPGRVLPGLRPFIGPPIGEVLQRAMPDLAPEAVPALVAAFRQSYDADGAMKTTLFPGVGEILNRARELGIRCFVASNKPAHITHRILQALTIHSRFARIVCKDSRLPPFASKAEMVACLLREFGLSPGATWLVGDCRDDHEAAQSNGVRFILAAYGYGTGQCEGLDERCLTLQSPGDLLGQLPSTHRIGVHDER